MRKSKPESVRKLFAMKLALMMKSRGYDRNGLAQAIEVDPTTIGCYLNAKTYPTTKKMERLANLFGVDPDDLDVAESEAEAEPEAKTERPTAKQALADLLDAKPMSGVRLPYFRSERESRPAGGALFQLVNEPDDVLEITSAEGRPGMVSVKIRQIVTRQMASKIMSLLSQEEAAA